MRRIPYEFVSKMSHDLKTPVGNAMMYTELMVDDIKNLLEEYPDLEDKLNPLIQYCNNIHLSSSKLINSIQSWGYSYQIEDGSFEIRAEDVDMKKLLLKVIASNEIFISGKSLDINLVYECRQTDCRSDPELLTLIFDNLLMLFINMARNGDEIRITVKDDDDGMMIRFFAAKASFTEILTDMFQSGISITDHLIPEQGILKPSGYGLLFASLALDFLNARFGVDEEGEEPRSYWLRLSLS